MSHMSLELLPFQSYQQLKLSNLNSFNHHLINLTNKPWLQHHFEPLLTFNISFNTYISSQQ